MMRWFFLLLIVVNLGLYLWGVQKENARLAAEQHLEVPAKGNLKLIKEISPPDTTSPSSESEVRSAETSESPGGNAAPNPASTQLVVDDQENINSREEDTEYPKPGAISQPKIDREKEQTVATPGASDKEKPQVGTLDDPLTVQEMIGDENSESFTDMSEPVSEAQSTSLASLSQQEPHQAMQGVSEPIEAEQLCGVVGPFTDRAQATALMERMQQIGLELMQRMQNREEIVGFWVVIPPLESSAEAIKMVHELKSAGVTDVARFHKGDLANGISLGMYSRRENAESRVVEIKKKGFESKVSAKKKHEKQYWLAYQADDGKKLQELRQILDQFPRLSPIKKSCPSIAPQ